MKNRTKVLAYGDSITWGFIPSGPQRGTRFAANVRWTGVLQNLGKDSLEVIEEGYNGRTTVLDDPDDEHRNGMKTLEPCLRAHQPIDWVVLALGTNDLKEKFSPTPEKIAEHMRLLILKVKEVARNGVGAAPKIIMVTPAFSTQHVLAQAYAKVAQEENVMCLDITQIISPSQADGVHWEADANQKFAELIYEFISRK